MGDMLTQEEINALLAGGGDSDADKSGQDILDDVMDSLPTLDDPEANADAAALAELEMETKAVPSSSVDASDDEGLSNAMTTDQKDVLGEVGNISMGTAATTLFTLLNNKVLITTPKVVIKTWASLSQGYDRPCVGIKVNYTEGLIGSNVLILKEHDVKVIADLMMGGEGNVSEPVELTELELSAISEAMNQMVGSSSTSLSSVIKRKIDIDTPQAMTLNFGDNDFFERTGFVKDDILACTTFRMEIGDLIDSEITQIIPIEFAKEIADKMMEDLMGGGAEEEAPAPAAAASPAAAPMPPPMAQAPMPQDMAQAPPPMPPPQDAYGGYPPQMAMPPQGMPMPPGGVPMGYAPDYRQPVMYPQSTMQQNINAQPAQFQALNIAELSQQKENMGIIMDVPLEVTVELGRTSRKIREILEFTPGTIVDLDKLAGEPIDILVNGKFVASGEVVVVDENFAVRVTDIVNIDKRI